MGRVIALRAKDRVQLMIEELKNFRLGDWRIGGFDDSGLAGLGNC